MSTMIHLGPASAERANFIAEAVLSSPVDAGGERKKTDAAGKVTPSWIDDVVRAMNLGLAWQVVDPAGNATPAQFDIVEGVLRVSWHVAALASGEQRMYELRPAAAAHDARRGIWLDDQAENGRVVVYYGGILHLFHLAHRLRTGLGGGAGRRS